MITVGTGLGGGFIINGGLLSGSTGAGGEVGHLTLVPGGDHCPCGSRGCWERYASGSGLHRAAAAAGWDERSAGHDVLSAAETHPAARQVVEGVARNLTRGILLLSSALDPALVILGGGLGSDPRFLAIAEEALAAAEVTLPRSRPQLRSAVLGPLAGADRAADLSQGPRANKSLPPVTNPCVQFNFMANPNWWRQAAVYQIYPRSFADSNGDGLDDIRGITTKVPYLKSLGVDAVWLSPFYPSALADGGYDVDDYRNVDPRLGTLQDLDEMAAALHAAGIKLIMDIAS